MSVAKGRPGYAEAALKGGDASPGGDGFGNEIERMLMDRPMTRQSYSGAPAPMSTGIPGNTLDELMAELGMLRGERGEPSLPDRQLGRNGTRSGPRVSSVGDGASLLSSGLDVPLRPSTPRSSATSAGGAPQPGLLGAGAAGQLVLPPAKGAMPVSPASASGPGRAQSPMSTRRSIPGALNGVPLGGTASPSPVGASGPAPPSGVLERQAQLEGRLEKMEAREQQLMSLISQLQQQVSTLSRAQQTTQQQLNLVATVAAAPPPAAPPPQPAAAPPPPPPPAQPQAAVADGRQTSPARAPAAAPPTVPQAHVSDEDFIQDDQGDSPAASPRQRSPPAGGRSGPPVQQQSLQQRLGTPQAGMPTPPATGAPAAAAAAGARANRLNPAAAPAPDWEVDVSQLRRELGALGANLVRLRDQVACMVPGGPSPLSEEVAAQAAAAAQLKQNLTQIAMDVVSLHKGLTSLKQNTERSHAALEKSLNDMQLQAQTNALNMMAAGPAPGGGAMGHSNAVAAALAATGGVTGSLEESLRSAFAKPAMRALPTFNVADMGFMPDNAGAAAAAAAFGGMTAGGGGGGGGGGRRDLAPPNGGGGGLGAALALLNSFEEHAAAEQAEQQKAAIIARQAVSIVDAKVKQVILHVDRHMQIISGDVEERLTMYEQTIIRMAQQIDRVQRVLRDIEGAATSRIVVHRGGKDVEDELAEAGRREAAPQEQEPEPQQPTAKENWVKVAAMATGRFVPQKPDEKRSVTRNSPHGYFRTPP